MGRSKADLPFGATTLLERIVTELQRAFDDVIIVAPPQGLSSSGNFPNTVIINDERPYEGPLLALARGLTAARHDAAFACSCDVPLLRAEVASSLCSMLGENDAVVPEIAGVAQPLHAVYRKRCLSAIDTMIAQGEKRLTKIVEFVSARRVEDDELRKIDPELRSFINVNTPGDYRRVLNIAWQK